MDFHTSRPFNIVTTKHTKTRADNQDCSNSRTYRTANIFFYVVSILWYCQIIRYEYQRSKQRVTYEINWINNRL